MRVTSGGDHYLPPGRSWGNFLALSSNVDLLQTGTTGRQIFLFNMAYFDCLRGTTRDRTPCPRPPLPSLVRVTDRPGSPDNPAVEFKGNIVAFDADGVFGGGGPQASRRQIFVLDRQSGRIDQITYSIVGDSTRPTMDRLGKVVVFESTAPLLGQGPPGVAQIFAYFRLSRRLIQLTNGAGPSRAASINSRGRQVTFESTAALTTKNTVRDGHDTGVSQIYVADVLQDGIGFSLKLLTTGNAPSRRPFIADHDGDASVAFESTATNLFGAAGGSGSQIYLAPTDRDGDAPIIEAVTNRTDFGDCTSPVFSATADHLSFLCTGDPLRNGTTGNRIFLQDRAKDADPTRKIWQITGRGDVQGPIAQNLGEWFLAFTSTADTSGTAACGRQIQIIDYYFGHWEPAKDPGALPPDLLPDSSYLGPLSNAFGTRIIDLLDQSDPSGGSRVQVTTQNGPSVSSIPQRGSMWLQIAPSNLAGEATFTIPKANVVFPPLPAGTGAYCLQMRGDGEGIIDCDGGLPGGDIDVTQDHDTGDVDQFCRNGCREDDPLCTHGFLGPHTGVCNGRLGRAFNGSFTSGGIVIQLPVSVRLAVDKGVLGWCTDDYDYAPYKLDTQLVLTSGTARGLIADSDAIPLTAISDSATGRTVPAFCSQLQRGDTAAAKVVGVLALLDFPSPPTFHDAVVTLSLETRARERAARAETRLGGTCRSIACNADADCIDTDICNGAETCVNQTCIQGTPLCDDGDACNGMEGCNPATGLCSAGTPPNCDDSNVCTFDACLPTAGCLHVSTCDDGNACNGQEGCDQTIGNCSPAPAPLDCNDNNPCTNDSCDPSLGCQYVSNANPCNDGDPCTLADACQIGTCRGIPIACSDNDVCNGAETCQGGACVPGTALACDDGNLCTDDTCDALLGCQHADNTAPCDDGNLCTFNDTCQNGACSGPAVVCADPDLCNGDETCNPADGSCLPGSPPNCDDNDACTADSCDPSIGCVNTPIGGPCQVIGIHKALEAMPAEKVGGPKNKRRLIHLLVRAERNLQRASSLKGAGKRRRIRAARQQMKQFSTIIDSGIPRGIVDLIAGRKLLKDVLNALNEIDTQVNP